MENFEIKDGSAFISVSPKIYPVDAIFSAAYVFTDKNYIVLDGNPEEEIIVEIRPKENGADVGKAAMEFNNELISYGSYAVQLARNAHLREHILRRVLQTAGMQRQGHAQETGSMESSKPWKK